MESQQSTIRTTLLMIGIIVLTVAFFVFTPKLFSNRAEPVKKQVVGSALANDLRITADIFVVKPELVTDELQTTGTIVANQEVDLVSEVARKLTRIYVHEGRFVQQGALLFKLDDADLLAKKKKIALQEKLARIDEKRFRELLATEAVNQQEYDQILTNLNVLQAELAILDVDLAKTEIRAPFSGKLGLNKVDVGAYVTPSTVLTSLNDVSQVEVAFTIPEKYASAVRIGQLIQFTTENSNQLFHGKVVATEPKTDLNTRSLLVKAISVYKGGKLIPGSSAKIAFTLHTTYDGILIPTQALIPSAKGYSLFALKNGKAEQRELKTGNRTKGTVQILEGLSLGDTVLTTNLLRLGPGALVKAASLN